MSLDFIHIEETKAVPASAQALFTRKYGSSIPDFPHHVVAYVTLDDGRQPACYIHFTDCGDILLGGGACVDDRVMRRMSADQRAAVHEAGGLYHHTLAWAVRHFAATFAAVFGYCGDKLAERVDRAVGFQSTRFERLLVFWTQDADDARRYQMVEKAQAFTPF